MITNYCWFKWNGNSYLGRIIYWDNEKCDVTVDNARIIGIPLNKVQAPYECKLPWE